MKLIMLYLLVIIILSSAILILIMMMGKKTIIDMQKSTPFECGFNPMSYKRLPFSIHFFLIAVLFLIFDIEIIIILPMVLTLKSTMTLPWMLTSMLFLMILIVGLYHEWINGMLNWTS